MRSRPGAVGTAIVLGCVVALLLGGSSLGWAQPVLPSSAGIDLSLATNGTLTAVVSTDVPNGSALRDAMDGNFTPLLLVLGFNVSETAQAVATIDELEESPLTAGYFGNHAGSVSPYEVSAFESLIDRESALAPKGLLGGSGVVPTTLDGAAPLSELLAGVVFTGATGPDSSPAPIGVQVQTTETFAYSGTTHALVLGRPDLPFDLPLSFGLNLSFTTPPGETITRVAGATTDQVTNDPLGWGSATMTGTLSATTNSTVTIDFQDSTPVGTILIGAGLVAAVLVAVAAVLWRRRRRRAGAAATGPGPAPPPSPSSPGGP